MPMPEKDTSQSATEALIDLRALELEIDKEIDALLVPAIQKAQRAAEGSKTAGEARNSSQPKTDPENLESAVTRSFSLDFNDLQTEIEKEIDNLFVPAVEYRDQAPVKTANKKPRQKMQGMFPAAGEKESVPAPKKSGPSPQPPQAAGASEKLDDLQIEIEKEIDNLFVPAVEYRDHAPVKTANKKPRQKMQGMFPAAEEKESVPAPQKTGPSPQPPQAAGASEKLDDLQIEIEKEIDNLFVPAAEYRDHAPVKTANKKPRQKMQDMLPAAGEKESIPAPKKSGPSPQPSQAAASEKFDDLQIEIEEEIDNLFVPAAEYRDRGPVQTGNEELSLAVQGMLPAAGEKESVPAPKKPGPSPQPPQAAASSEKLDDLQIEIENEIDNLLVPAVEYRDRGPVQTGNEELTLAVQDMAPAATEKESVPAPKKPGPSPQPSQAAAASEKLDDLKIEIEEEIDNLLVPAAEYRDRGPVQTGNEELTLTVQDMLPAAGEKESVSAPQPSHAAASVDDLQIEIEEEIDNLLVPAAEYRDRGPVQTGNEELTLTVQDMLPAAGEKESVSAPKKPGPLPEPYRVAVSNEKPGNAWAAERSHSHELAGLIERFNAAYLSLDWELSKEHIAKFLAVLNDLEPFASRSAEAKSVLRLMEVILKRLQARPHAVNSMLVRLIRDSQGLLAHMLLIDGKTGPHEKQQLKDLFARFNDLRQRALAVKAGTRKQNLEDIRPKAAAPFSVDEIHPPRGTSPALPSSTTETGSFEELRDWMDKIGRSLSENLKVFDTEIARIRQIEATLDKTADLAPIARRLNGIGNALEGQVDILRDKRGELIDRASRVARLETAQAHVKTRAQGAEPAAEADAVCEKACSAVYNESLYLIASNGKCLALPAGCVLKVARSSIKTRGKILKRGHATLDDFCLPLLRWIKSGVLGEWAKRPRKDLGSYRFEPVEPGLFDRSETRGQVAVLASDGNRHAVIFADSADLIADPQMAAGAVDKGDLGASENLQALFPLAFDPARPLSLPDQISSTTSATERCRR